MAPNSVAIYRVSAAGGVPVQVTKPGTEESQRFPLFLPDGRHFLYMVLGNKPDATGIYAGSLD